MNSFHTDVYFGDEAKDLAFKGIEKVYKAVAVTLGSRGKNAVMNRWGRPMITNDGVSIARKIRLLGGEGMGADLIKEAAEKTNEVAGDGTTTATILTYHLIDEGKKILKSNPSITPMKLRKELDEALSLVVKDLENRAVKVEGDEELLKVAKISAEDDKIAALVAEAVKEAGTTGRVVVEESQGTKIEKEKIEGMEIEGGFVSAHFINIPQKETAELNETHVLITNKTFSLNNEIFPLLRDLNDKQIKNLVVVCKNAQSEALATMINNLQQGKFNVIAVKAPEKNDMLEDLAAFCGKDGALLAETSSKNPTMFDLVRVQKVIATKNKTLFIKGERDKKEEEVYKARVDSIQQLVGESEDVDDKARLKDRLARITSSVVLLKVGASTNAEMVYLRLKIDDAVNAVNAAIKEGYVTGGGVTLRDVGVKAFETLGTEGARLLMYATVMPTQILVENAGGVYDSGKYNETDGFDTDSGTYVENIIERGIIDPVLVSKNAVINAVSLAGIFLTIETLIVDVQEKEIVE